MQSCFLVVHRPEYKIRGQMSGIQGGPHAKHTLPKCSHRTSRKSFTSVQKTDIRLPGDSLLGQ